MAAGIPFGPAAPALRDAMIATILGPALDAYDRDLLLAQWQEAVDSLLADLAR